MNKKQLTILLLMPTLSLSVQNIPAAESFGGIELPGVPVEITDPPKRSKKVPTIKPPPGIVAKVDRSDDIVLSNKDTALPTTVIPDTNYVPPSASALRRSGANPKMAIVKLEITPGVNQMIPISIGHLNRIVTPFDKPKVRSVSEVTTEVIKNVIYVASNDKSFSTLFISDKNEETAISITLAPKAIPPREIHLTLGNTSSAGMYAMPTSTKAKRWEESDNYIETLKKINTLIAGGKTPPGYSLREPVDSDVFVQCYQRDIALELGQVLDGHNMFIQIYTLTNEGDKPVEINETACYRPGIVSVTTWPRTFLESGEKTELIVTHSRELSESAKISRPSLLSY